MGEHESRRIIRSWWKEQFSRLDEVDLKVMSAECSAFLVNDPDFCSAFVAGYLEKAVYDIGIGTLAADRSFLRSGDTAVTAKALMAQVDAEIEHDRISRAARWAAWKEYDPETTLHVPLLQMTKDQCFRAAQFREDRARTDMQDALWLRLIAGKLQVGETVETVLSPEDLDELRNVAKKQATATLLPKRNTQRKAA